MPRERTGSVYQREDKSWWARITYLEAGKRKEKWRRAENKTHAKELVKQLIRELDDHGGKSLDAAQMTFAELADYFQANYIFPARYVNDRKIAGVRTAYDMGLKLNILKSHFGKKRIRAITFGDLESFKATRLNTKTKNGGRGPFLQLIVSCHCSGAYSILRSKMDG